MQKKYYTYILKCADATYYCGYTADIASRIREHNLPTSATKYTRSRRPVKLVYFEEFKTKSQAMKREAEIKRKSRVQKERLILKRLASNATDGN